MLVLGKHRDKFTTDFVKNKILLGELAIIRSKGLKNEMAGYITKFIKRENESKALKEQEDLEAEIEAKENQVVAKEKQVETKEEQVETKEEQVKAEEQETAEESIPQEIIVESASEESR
jgi:small subunit ribosomal protein S17e